jgi:hypothetical protein
VNTPRVDCDLSSDYETSKFDTLMPSVEGVLSSLLRPCLYVVDM